MNTPGWKTALVALLVATRVGVTGAVDASGLSASPDHVARWAAAQAVPLQTVEAGDDFADLRPLAALIGNARVVALGELTHGAHEPLAFRNRLLRYLVENLGFTAIAIESGFPESRRIHDFVAGGEGGAEAIVRNHLTWGFGVFEENVALVQWLRDYNEAATGAGGRRKVRFYGLDLSLGGPHGSTPTPAALAAALRYLDRVDPAAAAQRRAQLQPYLARLPGGEFSGAERDRLGVMIDDLIALFEREQPAFVAASSKEDYAWGHHAAVVARQAHQVFREEPPPRPGGGMPAGAWRQISARNAAMAENIRWILGQEGPGGRVLIFAHNLHVMNAPVEVSDWRDLERAPNAMGQYLRLALGDALVIIGTSSGAAGSAAKGTPDTPAEQDCLDATLARVGLPRFILDLRKAKADRAVHAWLTTRQRMRTNEVTSLTLCPDTAFDALLYIDALTPARVIESPE